MNAWRVSSEMAPPSYRPNKASATAGAQSIQIQIQRPSSMISSSSVPFPKWLNLRPGRRSSSLLSVMPSGHRYLSCDKMILKPMRRCVNANIVRRQGHSALGHKAQVSLRPRPYLPAILMKLYMRGYLNRVQPVEGDRFDTTQIADRGSA